MHRRIARVCKCGALVKVERRRVAIDTMLMAALGKVGVIVGGYVNEDVDVCWWHRRWSRMISGCWYNG